MIFFPFRQTITNLEFHKRNEELRLRQNKSNSQFENKLLSISKQSGIIFIETFAFQLMTFISSILLARILGTALLGRYRLGLVVIQLLGVLSIMGFDRGLMRYIPIFSLNDLGKTKKLILNSLSISLVLTIILSALLYIYSPLLAEKLFHAPEMIQVLRVFSFYLPIYTISFLGSATFNGFKRADLGSHVKNILAPIIFILFLSIIILLNGKLIEVIYARIFSMIIVIGLIVILFTKNFSEVIKVTSVRFDFKCYFNYSFSFLAIGLLYFFIGYVDILMLGYFMDLEEVGVYSIVVNISMLCIFGLHAVNVIFGPNISELYSTGDMKNLERLFKTLTKWIFYLSFFCFTFIVIFRNELLNIFGPAFIAGGNALLILTFGQLFNALTGSTGTILLMTGRQKWEVINSCAIIILNISLNLILIPILGIVGAAMATAISVSLINVLKLFETYKEFKIHPYNLKYVKGTLAIAIGGLSVGMFRELLITLQLNFILILMLGLLLFIVIFVSLIYFFKFDYEDKVILQRIKAKIYF